MFDLRFHNSQNFFLPFYPFFATPPLRQLLPPSTNETMSSALLCKPLRQAPLARANNNKAAAVAARAAAPRSSSALRAVDVGSVGSDWPANWALASFEDVGEYFNTKLLKVREGEGEEVWGGEAAREGGEGERGRKTTRAAGRLRRARIASVLLSPLPFARDQTPLVVSFCSRFYSQWRIDDVDCALEQGGCRDMGWRTRERSSD